MAIFYIADTHFGHANAIRFDNRPYESLDEMHEDMAARWNSVVRKSDTVYILGDFCFRMNQDEAKEMALKLNGKKHLILGNHDKKEPGWYKTAFVEVSNYAEIADTVQGINTRVVMSHYFIPFYNHARHMGFMLHGHTHKTAESEYEEIIKREIRDRGLRCEAYNVGCMWQDYYPQTLDQIVARQPRKVQVI